jgi:hypothetical protein
VKKFFYLLLRRMRHLRSSNTVRGPADLLFHTGSTGPKVKILYGVKLIARIYNHHMKLHLKGGIGVKAECKSESLEHSIYRRRSAEGEDQVRAQMAR